MSEHPTLTTFEMPDGAKIIHIPVEAFPGMWANLYLVETGDMLTLIDSGSGSDKSNTDLDKGLFEAGYNITDLTHILLTHGHIDHYGGLPYLRERTKAQIGVHELDLQTVSRHQARLALMTHRLEIFLAQAGIPADRRCDLLQMYGFTKTLYRSTQVDFTYEDQDMMIGPFDLIHLPGHCPGHVALKLDDIVFCGDLMLDRITPHQSPESLTPFMGLRHYLESLSVLRSWAQDTRLILSGHDEPISDTFACEAIIRQKLTRRIHQTLDALAEPRTIAGITQRVYGEMGGYNALLVIEKIGAYVEYLFQRGLLEIANLDELEHGGEYTPILYRRLHDVADSKILPKEKNYVFV